jgi:hypothetical protein
MTEYQGGVMQQFNPLPNHAPCFRCLPGSRAVFGVNHQNQPVTGSAACQLCAEGTYSDLTGSGTHFNLICNSMSSFLMTSLDDFSFLDLVFHFEF